MKKRLILIGCIFTLTFLVSCSDGGDEASTTELYSYQTITAQEAKIRIDSREEIVIVDVRTLEEYEAEHIEDAILIPNESIENEPLKLLPELEAEILLYCRSGNRSAQAAKKLVQIGYSNVFDFGGIIDWTYDTVTSS